MGRVAQVIRKAPDLAARTVLTRPRLLKVPSRNAYGAWYSFLGTRLFSHARLEL